MRRLFGPSRRELAQEVDYLRRDAELGRAEMRELRNRYYGLLRHLNVREDHQPAMVTYTNLTRGDT